MPSDFMLSAKVDELSHFDRRAVLIAGLALVSWSSLALGQNSPPMLFVLPKGITSPARFRMRSPKDPHKIVTLTNISLEGYLLCNGAAVSRADYKELFGVIETRYGRGDGKSTFNLPAYPAKYSRLGEPVSGMAMCPSSKLGLPVSVVLPFDTSKPVSPGPSQKPK